MKAVSFDCKLFVGTILMLEGMCIRTKAVEAKHILISQGSQTLEPYENTNQRLQAMEELHENPSSLR